MKRTFDPGAIKGLAIDLDGTTLLPNAILGARTRNCIRELIAKGMHIIIATGRAIESSERYRAEMGAQGPMVFFNGAEVADVPSGKILHTDLISMDVVDYGAGIARELGIHYQVYMPAGISPDTGKDDPKQLLETLLTERYGEEAEYYYKHTGITPVVKDLKKIAALPVKGCIKGMFIADPSYHDEVRRRIKDRFGDQVNILRSFPTFLEVLNAGVNKGSGLEIAMRHRGLKPEEVIAFGDEENDLSMFTTAGYACAPASAGEKMRNAADFVYGSNAEEGIAEYLEKVFL